MVNAPSPFLGKRSGRVRNEPERSGCQPPTMPASALASTRRSNSTRYSLPARSRRKLTTVKKRRCMPRKGRRQSARRITADRTSRPSWKSRTRARSGIFNAGNSVPTQTSAELRPTRWTTSDHWAVDVE